MANYRETLSDNDSFEITTSSAFLSVMDTEANIGSNLLLSRLYYTNPKTILLNP
jgi:hypothetical protein